MSPFGSRNRRRKRSPEDARKVLIKQIVIGCVLFVLVGLIGAGVWYGSRLEALTIRTINVSEGDTVSATDVRAAAEAELAGNYLGIVPRRFAWLYPQEDILAAVSALPRVADVTVTRDGGTEIVITFTEYTPTALWCQVGEVRGCVFIDETGYAFATAPDLSGSAFVRYSEVGRMPEVNVQAFTPSFLAASEELIAAAYSGLGFNIVSAEQLTTDEAVYRVAGGGEIKVSLTQSLTDTLENLETIITSPEYQHLTPGNFEYIDLRYGNKVFIMEEQVATTTAPVVAEESVSEAEEESAESETEATASSTVAEDE